MILKHCDYYQVKDIESKIRQRSFLHSISSPDEDNVPYSLTRTKSSGCVTNPSQSPSALLKSKSSTYISPDQSQALMYNTKVTLSLRRSNSQLNSSSRDLISPSEKYNGHSNGVQQNGTRNGGPAKSQNSYYFGCSPGPSPVPPPTSSKPSLVKTVRATPTPMLSMSSHNDALMSLIPNSL